MKRPRFIEEQIISILKEARGRREGNGAVPAPRGSRTRCSIRGVAYSAGSRSVRCAYGPR